jgi:hypothetical protein
VEVTWDMRFQVSKTFEILRLYCIRDLRFKRHTGFEICAAFHI